MSRDTEEKLANERTGSELGVLQGLSSWLKGVGRPVSGVGKGGTFQQHLLFFYLPIYLIIYDSV